MLLRPAKQTFEIMHHRVTLSRQNWAGRTLFANARLVFLLRAIVE